MAMTKAQFKTIREGIGATPAQVAKLAACHMNLIWRAESPVYPDKPIPENVEKAINTLAERFAMTRARLVAEAVKAKRIVRPATKEDAAAMIPELVGWPDRSIGLLYSGVHAHTLLPIYYPDEVPA